MVQNDFTIKAHMCISTAFLETFKKSKKIDHMNVLPYK